MDFMKLVLRIISSPEYGTSSENSKIFDSSLAIIGRGQNTDWYLCDPQRFISSKHAEVHLRNNCFYIRDISANGIINADTDQAIGKDQELLITNGQKLLIGDYLIQAELESISAIVTDTEPQPLDKPMVNEHAEWENQMDEFWGNSCDPLDLLTANTTSSDIDSNKPSSLADAIERTPAFKQAMNFTPTTNLTSNSVPSNLPAQEETHIDNSTSSGIPEDWDNTSFSFPAKDAPPSTVAPLDSQSLMQEHNIDQVFSRPEKTRPPKRQSIPAKNITDKSQSISSPKVTSQAAANDNLLESAKAAFQQQGLDDSLLTDVTALKWLELMPTVIQGTLDLLQARAAIKNEFRVHKTLLNTSENNPLKFSVNAEDAILSLFHQNRPGFQSAKTAFQQAYADINSHQSALLHGVRVAMMSLLKQFDADVLESEFSTSHKNSNFLDKLATSKSAQAKLWQQYKERYNNEYKLDSDDSFHRIFGENFAEAYDEFNSDL